MFIGLGIDITVYGILVFDNITSMTAKSKPWEFCICGRFLNDEINPTQSSILNSLKIAFKYKCMVTTKEKYIKQLMCKF